LRQLHDLRHSINMLWERLPDDPESAEPFFKNH